MNLQEHMQQIASIKEVIQQKLSHKYLKQFIDDPLIDEDRIMLLLESVADQDFPQKDIERFVMTAMLIQIALDTHEKVTNLDDSLKKRQLTVLAGDYFSGLYYKILAEVENVPLIRTLAEGIKLVNEHKIILYRTDNVEIDEYIEHLKKAESTIVTKFTTFFGAHPLTKFAEELLLLNRLIREKEKAMEGKASIFFEALKKNLFPTLKIPYYQLTNEKKALLLYKCENYIEQSIQVMVKAKETFPKINHFLEHRIGTLLTQQQALSNLFVEEG